eukprot:8633390-Lingulodinium_polyedra.AAC.1
MCFAPRKERTLNAWSAPCFNAENAAPAAAITNRCASAAKPAIFNAYTSSSSSRARRWTPRVTRNPR